MDAPFSSSDSDMFPTANSPPPQSAHLDQLNQPTALSSPPASQDPPHTNANGNGMPDDEDEAMDTVPMDGSERSERNGVGGADGQERGKGSDEFEPGAGWNNKRARDEWGRAWGSCEDKSFSLSE